ncbi:unnamed protein product (macronuclear) [Paramecium tetraurelia]|uniref:ER membrane protein complex subunit 2 n=1 Tax=Paramecium tetraurelia TaxID=5888 RepID=A0BK37_PARTE|nr:uncharacterized protein GSPATT00029534001 [Paramecium tetraurelia]CAK58904.1 unnamed protein product [Paramecium tetraurelia]|eukprot:XP_001426302.1 hypothetical protein (macronuclear) [Paramecium tetraurelia strain d4-2]
MNKKLAYSYVKIKMILENFLTTCYIRVQLNEKQKCFEQILELYDLTIQKYPSENEFLHMKATVLLNFNKLDESLELCDQIISQSPQQLNGYILKSKVLIQCGKLDEVIELWRQCVQQFCEVPEVYRFLSLLQQNLFSYSIREKKILRGASYSVQQGYIKVS